MHIDRILIVKNLQYNVNENRYQLYARKLFQIKKTQYISLAR